MHLKYNSNVLCNLVNLGNFWVTYKPVSTSFVLCQVTPLHRYTILSINMYNPYNHLIRHCLKINKMLKKKRISYVYTGKRKKRGNCVTRAKKQQRVTYLMRYTIKCIGVFRKINVINRLGSVTPIVTRGV